jgi:hypothetical protein
LCPQAMLNLHQISLEVYIEAQVESPERVSTVARESQLVKLRWDVLYQPEWAVAALRRSRHIIEVIDLGETTDRQKRRLRSVKVLYNGAISSIAAVKKDVENAAYVGFGSHL